MLEGLFSIVYRNAHAYSFFWANQDNPCPSNNYSIFETRNLERRVIV